MAEIPHVTLRDRRALRAAVIEELVRVEAQITSLARSFDDIVEAAELTSTDDEHDPEGSTIAFERSQVSSLLAQARSDREQLRTALQRTDEPGYGACERCGEFIGVERLLALPSAVRCISCARSGW